MTGFSELIKRNLGQTIPYRYETYANIEIGDRFSLVEVPEERADDIVATMKTATLRGKKVRVRRDRDAR